MLNFLEIYVNGFFIFLEFLTLCQNNKRMLCLYDLFLHDKQFKNFSFNGFQLYSLKNIYKSKYFFSDKIKDKR